MNWIIRRLLLFLVCILLFSFLVLGIALNTEVNYISLDERHSLSNLIGVNCDLLNSSWYVKGWQSFDDNKKIGSYELTKSGGKNNRFVLEVFRLEPNSQITIVDVKAADSIFLKEIKLEVKINTFMHRASININHINELCPNWRYDKYKNKVDYLTS